MMTKLVHYLTFAGNNICRNKLFSFFCIIVSALTCIFIYAILQMTSIINNDTSPFSNSDRTISFCDEFYDTQGRYLDGIPTPYLETFLKGLRNYESCAISNTEFTSVVIGDKMFPSSVAFVNSDYFILNDFEFTDGRAFTKEETWDVEKMAVITEKIARKYYGNISALGQELEIQGNHYKVIGVVKDYSVFSTVKEIASIWLPYSVNKFMPSGMTVYTIDVLFPKNVPKKEFKQDMLFALKAFYKNRGMDLDLSIDRLMTLKEQRLARYGNNGLFVGVSIIIFLLLLIPAINIITLSESGIQNRISELAVRRACGATKGAILYMIMTESFILVGIGFIAGIALAHPIINLAESLFFRSSADGTGATLLSGPIPIINVLVLICSGIIFSLISGGIPAYMAAKKNISLMLKGGSND